MDSQDSPRPGRASPISAAMRDMANSSPIVDGDSTVIALGKAVCTIGNEDPNLRAHRDAFHTEISCLCRAVRAGLLTGMSIDGCGNTRNTHMGPVPRWGLVFLQRGVRSHPRGFITAPFIRLTLMPVT